MCGGGKTQEKWRSGLRGGREGKGSAYSTEGERERERERERLQASKAQHTNNAQTGKSYKAQQAKHENSNSPKQVTSPNSLKYY
jgi:hypothetical protein